MMMTSVEGVDKALRKGPENRGIKIASAGFPAAWFHRIVAMGLLRGLHSRVKTHDFFPMSWQRP